MATERFEIIVSAPGAGAAARSIDNIGTSAAKTSSLLGQLRAGLVLFAALKIGGQLAEFADSFTLARNRLQVFTGSTETAGLELEKLLKIANDTRTDFDATATVFTRMARAVQGTTHTFGELEGITTTINQLIALSGTTTAEATNALIQFSQGLASGALRGDELRSVVEQIPALAQIIGQEFGVAAGQLASFGKQNPGIITTERILKALRERGFEVAEQFKNTATTFGQAFVVIQNSLTKAADEFNKITGLSKAFAQAAAFAAENVDVLTRAVIALGAAFVALQLAPAVSAMTSFGFAVARSSLLLVGFGGFARGGAEALRVMAVAGNLARVSIVGAFTAIPAAIGLAIGAAFIFKDQLILARETGRTMGDVFTVVGDRIGGVLNRIGESIGGVVGSLFEAAGGAKTWGEVFGRVADLAVKGIDIIIASFSAMGAALGAIAHNIGVAFENIWKGITNLALETAESIVNSFGDALNQLSESVGGPKLIEGLDLSQFRQTVVGVYRDVGKESGDAFSESIKGGFTKASEAVGKERIAINTENARREALKSAALRGASPIGTAGAANLNANTKALESAQRALDNILKQVGPAEKFNDIINDTSRAFAAAAKAGIQNLPPLNDTIKALIDKELGIRDVTAEYRRESKLLDEQLKAGNITEQQHKLALDAVNASIAKYNEQGLELIAQFNPTIANQLKMNELRREEKRLIDLGLLSKEQAAEIDKQALRDNAGLSTATRDYAAGVQAVNDALAANATTTEEAAAKMRDLRIAFLDTQTDFSSGWERALLKLNKQYTDTASQIEGLLNNTFSKLGDELTSFFTTGKADFKSLADSIINDITRIIIQQALLAPLTGLLGGGGQGGGGGGLLGGLLGGGGGGGFFGGSSAGGSEGGLGGLLGSILGSFDEGADFTVGGRTGRDNNLLVARVSRGERVSITPVGKDGSGNGKTVIQFNIQTPDVDSFRKSQGQLMAEAAAALQRAQRRNG